MWWQGLPEGSEEVVTRKVWEESWWARRRACSPMGTARMCSFWISSMLPMVRPDSLAMARLSGKLALLKLVIKFTCNPALLFAGCTGHQCIYTINVQEQTWSQSWHTEHSECDDI